MMQQRKSIRILVVSERNVVRAGYRALLENVPDLKIVGEAENVAQAIKISAAQCPDIAMLDSESDSIDVPAVRRMIALQKAKFTLMLVDSIDQRVRQLRGVGVDGVLLNQSSSDMICAAVRLIAAGYTLISPAGARQPESTIAAVKDSNNLEHLTRREADVLRLIARGMTNAEISTELSVSESTVKSHVQHMFNKLELRNRVHAVIFAYEIGIVRTGTTAEATPPALMACAG
ncbi:response regulator transcription factor [Streptomyces sp. NPDC048290]|uniref:response regulator transcription factor n=1 Tax=Streptomyces sp. NPDC048290 TaxID=3155811 RepID=UPI00341A93DC